MNQFIDVNKKRLEISLKGTRGIPILILSGMGCSFEEWFEVTELLGQSNRTIMFHRPGLGESEIGGEKRTTLQVVEEINQVLRILQIEEPVILIGHSYGGLCAQHFTKLHPEKVMALFLIDATSVELERLDTLDLPVLNQSSSDEEWLEACKKYALSSEQELKKMVHPVLSDAQKKLPHSIQTQLIEFQQKPNLYKAMKSETENWKADAKAIKKLKSLSDPLLVVMGRDKKHVIQHGIDEGLPETELTLLEDTWEELILEQAVLSTNNKVIFAENASHSIHLDRPDLIIKIVKEITNKFNKHEMDV